MANSAKIGGLNIDLSELSTDTSPQLGGNLDLNSNDITGTGNVNTTGTITSSGAITSSGTVTGNTFSGSGASLTNLNASNLASGTIPDVRFPSRFQQLMEVILLVSTQIWFQILRRSWVATLIQMEMILKLVHLIELHLVELHLVRIQNFKSSLLVQ